MKKSTENGCKGSPRDKRPNKENERDDRRVLLAITVEIEDGCVEHIEMKEGDSAEAVAKKFCGDHLLPEQFVAPLTEHIVSNIVSLSKENKELSYHGTEEHGRSLSYESTRLYQSKPGTSPKHESGLDQESKSGRWCCKQRTDGDVQARERSKNTCIVSQSKNKTKIRRRLSERLLAPTLTSLAKRPQAVDKDKSKELASMIKRPLNAKAEAVYMRLYAEFLRQKQRIELEKIRNMEIYQEKIDRDRAYVSKKSWRIWRMRGRTAKQYGNYGELLYSEGLSKMEQLKKMIQKKQEEDEAKELKELTLKPEISKRAKQIRRDQGQIWHRLQSADKPRQDQMRELRNEIWEAKLMECTFKPRINHRRYSQKFLNDGSTSRFEQLFLDAENRRRRQAEYTQWYPEGVTFQPHINRQRQHHGLDRDDGYYQETTVFDRLLHYASKLVEKKQMWQQMAAKPVDPTTGQELFTPMTGRKPLQNRNTSELPIGEFLYQLKDTMDRKKQWLAERDLQAKREQASCHYVGPRSQRLLEGIKERRFQQIFDYLDQDKDGFVELETADLNQLSDDVVEDVARIREMGVEKLLDYQSFVDHMKTIQEKAGKNGTVHLVLKHKKHDSPMHIQFKMDRYSRDLAVRRRRFSSSRQWYKLILADRAKWQSDLEALRKERQSLEMKECTFRPEIQKKRGHAKVSRVSHERMGPPASRSFSKIREKEQREVHGFIFEAENNQKPDRLAKAASSVSHDTHSHVESQSHAGDMTPVGLLESLKSLKQIVAQSESTEGGSPNLPQGQDMQEVYFESRPYPWRPAVERVQSSVVNDLPDPEKQKDGLYVGLLGA
ncbi:hypothetical protein MPTK1_2g07010 [Marchantia polymorpha subsp. ruderalis]|uniref:EF-hand domain-containing protein n=1 Tax=Marchantia polymorpha TaxID=3197 RepID=A0A2R6XDY1_MARPO|nr:hypothetical protein MARPO_0021s0154 [Marchantia polymorpha]PTQ44311.1 hypothetical protein MARPO_0021s0154 [Marchantia polymorpha]BBN01385.1 hypothetical protein Mp_2g07010 [Marchantia polymorpha subsp. ruderalis]BBN01386.1 hypothetical protein Mp_2g07010 [Marchantia polymorpha subsp. ruderalis]|eukprot:PTQ44310.1 hypothetical protein MARPO_0021s0154 [Marchantia polymorpha]